MAKYVLKFKQMQNFLYFSNDDSSVNSDIESDTGHVSSSDEYFNMIFPIVLM